MNFKSQYPIIKFSFLLFLLTGCTGKPSTSESATMAVLASIFIFLLSFLVLSIYSKIKRKEIKFKKIFMSIIFFIFLFSITLLRANRSWNVSYSLKDLVSVVGLLYILVCTLIAFGIGTIVYSIIIYFLFEKISMSKLQEFTPLIITGIYCLILIIETLYELSPGKLAMFVFNPWAIPFLK